MTYVLITRPQLEGVYLQTQLGQSPRVPCFCEPMLQMVPLQNHLSFDESEGKITDIIVTSARVLEIIENWAEYLHLPIWCVGEVTARVAKKKGFTNIHVAERSAQDLLDKILTETEKEHSTRRFVHICGDTLHLDLSHELGQRGYHAQKLVIYRTEPVTVLSKELVDLLKKKSIVLAPFFSQRTTEIFVGLVKKHKLEKQCRSIVVLAHSEAVAEKLRALAWSKIEIVPDLGEEKIRFFYDQIQQGSEGEQKKEMIASSQRNTFAGTMMSWYPAIGIGTLFLMVMVIWWVLLPSKLESVKQDWIQQQALIQGRHWEQYQILMAEQRKGLEQELMTLKKKLADVEKTIPKLPPFLTESIDRLEKMLRNQFSQERSHDILSFMTHQKLMDCEEHLKKSYLTEEDRAFLKKEGVIPVSGETSLEQEILSVPQLLKNLGEIDFTVYTSELKDKGESGSWWDKMGSFLKDKVGIQIQKKMQLPMKDVLKSHLEQYHFAQLKELSQQIKQLPEPLRSRVQEWQQHVLETKEVLDKISDHQKAFSDQLSVSPKAVNPESTSPPEGSSLPEGDH